MTTKLGSSLVIEGDVLGEDPVQVSGVIKGRIAIRGELTLEVSADVEGEVNAESLTLSGRLQGKARADNRLEITNEGRMIGDIRARRILIADGAQFKGNIDMN